MRFSTLRRLRQGLLRTLDALIDLREPTAWGVIDEGLDGGDQSAVTGKPNGIVGPQAGVVEAGSLTEGIVAATMGIAGKVIQELEFAKDGEVGVSAECAFEFGQGCNFVAQQVLALAPAMEVVA